VRPPRRAGSKCITAAGRVIHLYIWPTTETQVVSSNFGTSVVATISYPRGVSSPEESLFSQIRLEEENLVINRLLGSFWNKNASFDAFRVSFCSIEMFLPQKRPFHQRISLCSEQIVCQILTSMPISRR
jgi:hypothetical protein